MNFSLREFIKKGFLDAVGKMADYQIILNATGYFEKGVLLEEDLEEINNKIEEQYIQEPIIEEPIIEEPVIEEPVIEEPVIEEPVEEEPVIEEPVEEEPVEEEPVEEDI